MSYIDKNGKPVAEGVFNKQTIPWLCDDEGKLILEAGSKNINYTPIDETAILNNNGVPSLIAITPLGNIRRIKTTSDGKIKFVQK